MASRSSRTSAAHGADIIIQLSLFCTETVNGTKAYTVAVLVEAFAGAPCFACDALHLGFSMVKSNHLLKSGRLQKLRGKSEATSAASYKP